MKRTEILVITDRSGSMAPRVNDVIGGYNQFIKEQKEVAGEARVTYTQFDNVYEVVYAGRPLAEVPLLDTSTFVPRAATALLDAVGRTLNEQGQRIAQENWAELVIVCIITDGQENASKEYTKARIKEMCEHAAKNGWHFVYLGANQDAFAETQAMGMTLNTVAANFAATAAGVGQAYGTLSSNTRSLRSGKGNEPTLSSKP